MSRLAQLQARRARLRAAIAADRDALADAAQRLLRGWATLSLGLTLAATLRRGGWLRRLAGGALLLKLWRRFAR